VQIWPRLTQNNPALKVLCSYTGFNDVYMYMYVNIFTQDLMRVLSNSRQRTNMTSTQTNTTRHLRLEPLRGPIASCGAALGAHIKYMCIPKEPTTWKEPYKYPSCNDCILWRSSRCVHTESHTYISKREQHEKSHANSRRGTIALSAHIEHLYTFISKGGEQHEKSPTNTQNWLITPCGAARL